MGQNVAVAVSETLDPDVRRFSTDRWLTGMGGRLYFDPEIAPDGAPKIPVGGYESKIFELGGIKSLYIYGSELTITKGDEASWDDLAPRIQEILAGAFRHYP
ncbi:MAG: hypothetical protein DCC49_04815 [Acidobacteria bacterium]|nr:MAG: hypothetical protein DCC49_04815 [Acidobacteriota bacterium]